MTAPTNSTSSVSPAADLAANRITSAFHNLRARKKKALMPFLCGGFPRPGLLASILSAVHEAGASIVEVGIPFSDPIADGPVIAAAMHEALSHGATPRSVFEEVRAYRAVPRTVKIDTSFGKEHHIYPGAPLPKQSHSSIVGGVGGIGGLGADRLLIADLRVEVAKLNDPLAREMLGFSGNSPAPAASNSHGAAKPKTSELGPDIGPDLGIVAMVSISIVHRMGTAMIRAKQEAGVKVGTSGSASAALAFCREVADHGFDGLIVPDCPLDEAHDLTEAAGDAGLTMTHLLAPTTSPERAERIVKASSGFVYMLARAGITGERQDAPDISGKVGKLRQMTDLPIAVGFGISSAEHVRSVVQHADAAIVGTAMVRRMSEAGAERAVTVAAEFTRQLAEGLT